MVEILATRTPPQLQECLAVYKHGKGRGAGGRELERELRTVLSFPAVCPGEPSGSLSAHVILPGDLCPHPGLCLPRETASCAQDRQKQ